MDEEVCVIVERFINLLYYIFIKIFRYELMCVDLGYYFFWFNFYVIFEVNDILLFIRWIIFDIIMNIVSYFGYKILYKIKLIKK